CRSEPRGQRLRPPGSLACPRVLVHPARRVAARGGCVYSKARRAPKSEREGFGMKRSWLFATLLLAWPVGAEADHEALKPDDFPSRPIEMIVVYPAGGGMDITARTLARETEKLLPVDIVV